MFSIINFNHCIIQHCFCVQIFQNLSIKFPSFVKIPTYLHTNKVFGTNLQMQRIILECSQLIFSQTLGTFGFNFFFNMIFTYRYCRMLEENSFRGRTADFVTMFIFGSVFMIFSALFVNLLFLGEIFFDLY